MLKQRSRERKEQIPSIFLHPVESLRGMGPTSGREGAPTRSSMKGPRLSLGSELFSPVTKPDFRSSLYMPHSSAVTPQNISIARSRFNATILEKQLPLPRISRGSRKLNSSMEIPHQRGSQLSSPKGAPYNHITLVRPHIQNLTIITNKKFSGAVSKTSQKNKGRQLSIENRNICPSPKKFSEKREPFKKSMEIKIDFSRIRRKLKSRSKVQANKANSIIIQQNN